LIQHRARRGGTVASVLRISTLYSFIGICAASGAFYLLRHYPAVSARLEFSLGTDSDG